MATVEDNRRDLDRDTPPSRSSSDIDHDLREIAALARQISKLRPTVEAYSYSRSHWGEPDDATNAEALSQGMKATGAVTRRPVAEHDPTLDALTNRSKQGARRAISQSDRGVSEALSRLRACRQALRKAIIEPRDRHIEPKGAEYPRMISTEDLAASKAAAQRRAGRGEG